MLGKDFADMVRSGLRPVIVFNKGVEALEAYPEAGMRAKVVSAVVKHDDMFVLRVDYTDFDEFNKHLEVANYYDAHGNATMTAREAGRYTPQENIYLDLDAKVPFVVEESARLRLYEQYLQYGGHSRSSEVCYIQWLEDRLTSTGAAAQKLASLLESHPALSIDGDLALLVAQLKTDQ